MAVRRLETTCPDCGGGQEPSGTIAHRRCDGAWHLDAGRHVPLDTTTASRRPMPVGVAAVGSVAGAALLALSWWWLALLLPSTVVLAVLAVRR